MILFRFLVDKMRYYLSSYRLWDEENIKKFTEMCSITNKKVAYINNAIDYSDDQERIKKWLEEWFDSLKSLWLSPELIDLRNYFGKKVELQQKLEEFDIVRVRWWNTFVLRQAMKLSWIDEILINRHQNHIDKIYAWYSAWVCVLGPTLKWLSIVDDPSLRPYWDELEVIWDWLWILPYMVAPHYKSDHNESADIDKEVELMIDKKMLFIALRDWEAIIIN